MVPCDKHIKNDVFLNKKKIKNSVYNKKRNEIIAWNIFFFIYDKNVRRNLVIENIVEKKNRLDTFVNS